MKAHRWRVAHHPRILNSTLPHHSFRNARFIATDSRNRLSKFWTPTGGLAPQDGEQDDSHALLVRAGFLRQAHSGVFHLLPLGLRVQSRLESLIDTHMHSIGASKASLSSITTEALWRQSGRYSSNSELLRITDRRESGFLLSPTHEEEITALVASMVHSYKDLPLRLYQIGRKYRDERRPRQGLLRAKEFMMKDLYTFDSSSEAALETYASVRAAYTAIFDALKLPYLVADADSGNMGGKLSHEYHFPSPKGEDNVWSCSSCSYVANEELVEKAPAPTPAPDDPTAPSTPIIFEGISTDHKKRIQISVPRPATNVHMKVGENQWNHISTFVNLHAVKRALAQNNIDLDTGIEAAALQELFSNKSSTIDPDPVKIMDRTLTPPENHRQAMDITPITPGSACPQCPTGTLSVTKAIEIAHTFHLGTRYSEPLGARIALQDTASRAPMHMGCHGIGVSRLIGAIASLLSDARGLNWPRAIAPFETLVLAAPQVKREDVLAVYDLLDAQCGGRDVVAVDDRADKGLGWKLKDADLIGYPVVVVLGRGWKEGREVEVQCRRLGVKKDVGVGELVGMVQSLLGRL